MSRLTIIPLDVSRWDDGIDDCARAIDGELASRGVLVAAGVLEAVKGFRRLKGHKAMPHLVAALRARDQQLGLVVGVENVA